MWRNGRAKAMWWPRAQLAVHDLAIYAPPSARHSSLWRYPGPQRPCRLSLGAAKPAPRRCRIREAAASRAAAIASQRRLGRNVSYGAQPLFYRCSAANAPLGGIDRGDGREADGCCCCGGYG